jgi:hypothetical protein
MIAIGERFPVRRCTPGDHGRFVPDTARIVNGMKTLAAAEEFILTNARLLDRVRFAFHFRNGSAEAVRAALAPYANSDGGFGNALEPDLRGAGSQPVPVEVALHTLHEIGATGDPLARDAADYLPTITTDEGGIPFVLPDPEPCAPWWQEGDASRASVNPTASIVGLLHALGIEHPWRDRAEEFCWTAIKSLAGGRIEPYDFRAILVLLDHHPDRDRATATLAELRDPILAAVTLDPEAPGHIHRPIDIATTPDRLATSLFDRPTMDRQLDWLEQTQLPDGGWDIDWPAWCPAAGPEWRGNMTLGRLLTLRAYGRLQI